MPRTSIQSVGNAKARARRRKKQLSAALFERAAGRAPEACNSEVIVSRVPLWRPKLIVVIFAFAFTTVAARAFFLATNPINQLRATMVAANSPQDSLAALVRQADQLESLSQNIEAISIATLRQAMNDSVAAAQRAALDFDSQSKAWSELRGKIKNDSSTYDQLRKDLYELKKMQSEEIVRLKTLLDEAQRPSLFADIWNLVFSFALGIGSSVFASALYDKLKRPRLTHRTEEESGKTEGIG